VAFFLLVVVERLVAVSCSEAHRCLQARRFSDVGFLFCWKKMALGFFHEVRVSARFCYRMEMVWLEREAVL
jgi:hypothetical protein